MLRECSGSVYAIIFLSKLDYFSRSHYTFLLLIRRRTMDYKNHFTHTSILTLDFLLPTIKILYRSEYVLSYLILSYLILFITTHKSENNHRQ
ncbi:MAG: hypothetical protein N3A65_02700, partial [candidate division WOR-3 bacterium]|nr:hypothetical protein [candidate division WOR-3 bacterium]